MTLLEENAPSRLIHPRVDQTLRRSACDHSHIRGKPGGSEQRKEVERACADGDVDRAIGSDLLLVHRMRPLVGVDMASDAQVHLVSVQQPWPEMNSLIRCQRQARWMGGQQKAPSIATLIFSASPWCAQLELYQGLGRQRSSGQCRTQQDREGGSYRCQPTTNHGVSFLSTAFRFASSHLPKSDRHSW